MGEMRQQLQDRSWAGVFRDQLLDDLPIDELRPYLEDRLGRPSKDLHIVIGILLLKQLHDPGDAATAEALASNMAWHHAPDVRSGLDCYFCEKTSRNHRRLLITEEWTPVASPWTQRRCARPCSA